MQRFIFHGWVSDTALVCGMQSTQKRRWLAWDGKREKESVGASSLSVSLRKIKKCVSVFCSGEEKGFREGNGMEKYRSYIYASEQRAATHAWMSVYGYYLSFVRKCID